MSLKIEKCQNTTFNLEESVISGIEVINCQNLTFVVKKRVPIYQIDGSSDCYFEFTQETMGTVVSHLCFNLTLKLIDVNVTVTVPNNPNRQYISKLEEGSITCEEAIREGMGYITTQREKDRADALQEKQEKALMEMIDKLFVKK